MTLCVKEAVPLHQVGKEVLDLLLSESFSNSEGDVSVFRIPFRILERVVKSASWAGLQVITEELKISIRLSVRAVNELLSVQGVDNLSVFLGSVPLSVDWVRQEVPKL